VSGVARYQRGEQLRRDGDVVTSRGVDAITGLAVLVYDFPGAPRVKPGQVVVDGVPTVLAAGFDGEAGVLVTAYPEGAMLVAPGEAVVDDRFALQALTVLRDAARAGLVHGDLHAGRFLWARGRLYLEGYGVPWNGAALRSTAVEGSASEGAAGQPKESLRAALARDLAAAVKALLELAGDGMSLEVSAALKGALGTAIRAGDAEQLYAVVRRLAGGAVTVPPASFGELVLPTVASQAAAGAPAEAPAEGVAPGAGGAGGPLLAVDLDALDLSPRPAAGASVPTSAAATADASAAAPRLTPVPPTAARAAAERPAGDPSPPPAPPLVPLPTEPTEPDPITLNSDPGSMLDVKRTGGSGFVKDLPPGATYHAGKLDEEVRVAPIRLDVNAVPKPRRRSVRVPLLFLALFAVALTAGYLALVVRRDAPNQVQGAGAVNHIVDVRVAPANMPPVRLMVEQSPPGSAYPPGTQITTVPRRVTFDANGVWTVYAQYGEQRGASATVRVPEDTVVTLPFPEAPAGR